MKRIILTDFCDPSQTPTGNLHLRRMLLYAVELMGL